LLVLVYPKSEKDDLTPAEKISARRMIARQHALYMLKEKGERDL